MKNITVMMSGCRRWLVASIIRSYSKIGGVAPADDNREHVLIAGESRPSDSIILTFDPGLSAQVFDELFAGFDAPAVLPWKLIVAAPMPMTTLSKIRRASTSRAPDGPVKGSNGKMAMRHWEQR